MDLHKLAKILSDNNQPKFRLGQIKKAIFQDGVSSFLDITTLSKELRDFLDKEIGILPFTAEKILVSKMGDSVKASLRLRDGNLVETVLLSAGKDAWSVCISTQVGCPLNCGFCATGQGGFKRNLTAEEITDQVLFWKQYLRKSQISNPKSQINSKSQKSNSKIGNWKLPARKCQALAGGEIGNYHVSNVVFMGMGEPFLNWANVKKSLEDLINPEMFGFGSRSISISTCGIPKGIENLAKDFPQINLAISLHFADDKKRSLYMPINKKYNLEDLKNTLEYYFRGSKRKVFLEYIMLDKINNSEKDAWGLVGFIKSIQQSYLLHVNLIQYNSTRGDFKPSSKNQMVKFKKYLEYNHVSVTIRKSLGQEIQGACGQLAEK